MKIQIKYWIIMTTFMSLMGCESFIEVEAPNNQILAVDVFTTKSGAESAWSYYIYWDINFKTV